MILLKLGGSVITDKSVPLSYQKEAVAKISHAIHDVIEYGEPVVVVHGGGSYGHYYSVKHDMHTDPDRYDLRGLAEVKNSMVHLNHLVLGTMFESGLNPYSCPPSVFVHGIDKFYSAGPGMQDPENRGMGTIRERVREIGEIAESGMCPVIFGDAMWSGPSESYILSGDTIMVMLADMLRPRLAIFATDVDGLYTAPDSGVLIRTMDADMAKGLVGSWRPMDCCIESPDPAKKNDVTGGMRRKVHSADMISAEGVDVLFVNGNKPRRIVEAARGEFNGTLFAGRSFEDPLDIADGE